jgi:hypothetical protein
MSIEMKTQIFEMAYSTQYLGILPIVQQLLLEKDLSG